MILTNCFFVFLVIGLPIIQGGVIQDEPHPHSFATRLGEFFSRRCLKNKDLVYLEELLRTLADFMKCLRKILPKHDDDDNEVEKNCLAARTDVLQCMQRLMDFLNPCLHPQEKYMTKFVMDSFGAYLEYFCEHIYMLTIEGLLDSNMSKCLNRFKKHHHMNPHDNCYDAIHFTDHLKGTPIKKEELCSDLDVVYSCYQHKFHTHCADAPKAWEFQGGLLNATRSPCYSS